MGRLFFSLSDDNRYSSACMTDESPFQSLNSIKSGSFTFQLAFLYERKRHRKGNPSQTLLIKKEVS